MKANEILEMLFHLQNQVEFFRNVKMNYTADEVIGMLTNIAKQIAKEE